MNVELHERDFFREPLAECELRTLLAGWPAAEAFAWNSPRARAMGLSRHEPPADDELIGLMLENPYLVRRPVIRIGERTLFGFNQEQVEALLR